MATYSIMKNITITKRAAAEAFISAMEKAAKAAETSTQYFIESEDISGDELRKLYLPTG